MLSVDLPPEPASATRARQLARDRLTVSSATPEVLDTVALLVTELVTNSILHARTPLRLVIEAQPRLRSASVWRTPRPSSRRCTTTRPTRSPDAASRLVEQLASSWGVDTDADREGRVVRDRDLSGRVRRRRATPSARQRSCCSRRPDAPRGDHDGSSSSSSSPTSEVDSPPARLLDVISRLRANYDQLGLPGNRRFALEAFERGDGHGRLRAPGPRGGR